MSTPLFTIIVPTFGVEDFITDCLESIRRQTCADCEILVMDGGSTDKTIDLVARQQAAFAGRLLLRSEKDAGVYDAMNQGIRRARGKWLYFLGADDCLHDDRVLENVAAQIQNHPDDHLVYGDVILRSNASRYAGEFNLEKLLLEKNICHQAIFYQRTIFNQIGCYNLRYPIWADWDLNIRCFQHPEFRQRYLDLVIADYNDTRGVSMQPDLVLQKILPVYVQAAARSARSAGTLRKVLRRKLGSLRRRLTGT